LKVNQAFVGDRDKGNIGAVSEFDFTEERCSGGTKVTGSVAGRHLVLELDDETL
jgi:hypothetical protein